MKWLLFSDPQFDEQWAYAKPGAAGLSTRLSHQIECLDWAFKVARQHKCGGLITMGDVFDSRTELSLPVIDSVCAAYQRGKAAAGVDFQLIFLVGNHDAYLRDASVTSLRMFDGYAEVVSTVRQIGKFAFVPWCDNRDKYISGLTQASAHPGAEFLCSHGIIKGAVPDPTVGYDVALFEPARWKGVWMGDVHGPRSMAKNVHYVGAPMQHHFGDAGGERGVVVLDDITGKFTRVPNDFSPAFHILRDDADVEALDGVELSQDFIRVELPDEKHGAAIAVSLRAYCPWVEAPAVGDEGAAAPRLDIKTATSNAAILDQYCTFKGVADPRYREVGEAILKEAGL